MIGDIQLQNFRSYKNESFEFDSRVNIIVGPNASGKTNLLEAILMISGSKSYRVKDIDTIMYAKPWARLDANTISGLRSLKLKRNLDESVNKVYEINKDSIKRLSQTKKIPVVMFEPNHLLLFHGIPEARRDYLDDLLEQMVPGFQLLRKQYKRTLMQRNRLLKQHPNNIAQLLFVWNIRLSELGGQIAIARVNLVNDISMKLPAIYKKLSNSKAKLSISYFSKISITQYSSQLLHKLEASLDKDLERGFTAYGPHRDDILIDINSHTISESASRGEIRTILLGLKIIELELVENVLKTKPIILMDDVFSELDGVRRRMLTKAISGYQTFITTTDADIVVQHFMGECTIIPIGSGS